MDRIGRIGSRLVLLVAMALAWGSQPRADDGRRIALVIGNAAYEHAATLANPHRDAQAVAAALRRVGFTTVEVRQDVSRTAFLRALQAFAGEARTAELALVFYAGHGIEVAGRNFLIPTDARLATDNDVEFEAVPLDLVLHAVEGAKRLRLVLLDACRDNPFLANMAVASGRGRSIGRGLGRVEPPADTLVAYSAKDGQVAQDGTGANSPYTTALLQHIETPGLEIQFLFRKVRDGVLTATGNQQEPYVYGSLGGEPYFLSPPAGAPAVSQDFGFELAFWQSLEQSRDANEYQEYLRQFPNGTFALLARNRLRELQGTARPAETVIDQRMPAPSAPAAVARPAPAPRQKPPASTMFNPAGSASSAESRRCANILARSQLGEPLSAASIALCGTAGHDPGEPLLPHRRTGAHRLAERLQHASARSSNLRCKPTARSDCRFRATSGGSANAGAVF